MERIGNFCKIIKSNAPLSDYTTFGIGGNAWKIAHPKTEEELIGLISYITEENIPYIILGKGSNVLVSDKGFDGVVIVTTGLKEISYDGDKLFAQCGVTLPALSKFSLFLSLSGLEFAVGIPATVGGAVYMNAGAYGSDIGSVLHSCRVLNNGKIVEYTRDELGFEYRKSRISTLGTVVSAKFNLVPKNACEIEKKMRETVEKRRQTQPKAKSCGCIFKSHNNISAGYYIDKAGLKGLKVGGAEVSRVHAGFIVNTGSATAQDVLELIKKIQSEVYAKFGVELFTEINFLGDYDEDLRRLSHTYDI